MSKESKGKSAAPAAGPSRLSMPPVAVPLTIPLAPPPAPLIRHSDLFSPLHFQEDGDMLGPEPSLPKSRPAHVLRVGTFNCQGSDATKLQQVEQFAIDHGLDILGLQELSMSRGAMHHALYETPELPEGETPAPDAPPPRTAITKGKLLFAIKAQHFRGNGAALWIANRWTPHITANYDVPGRMVGRELRFEGNRQLFIASVYMPATEKTVDHKADQADVLRCLERMHAVYSTRLHAHWILLGDWNSVAVPARSRITNGRFVDSRTPERTWWNTLLDTYKLHDAATQKNTDTEITHESPRPRTDPQDQPAPVVSSLPPATPSRSPAVAGIPRSADSSESDSASSDDAPLAGTPRPRAGSKPPLPTPLRAGVKRSSRQMQQLGDAPAARDQTVLPKKKRPKTKRRTGQPAVAPEPLEPPADLPPDAIWNAGRIDAILHSASLVHALCAVHACPPEVGLPHRSDHCPVLADYDLTKANLSRPTRAAPQPKPGPPMFVPHTLEPAQLKEMHAKLEAQLSSAKEVIDAAIAGAGTHQERIDRLMELYTMAGTVVTTLAKEYKCYKPRGTKRPEYRQIPWQAQADKLVARIMASWRRPLPTGAPSPAACGLLRKLVHIVTTARAAEKEPTKTPVLPDLPDLPVPGPFPEGGTPRDRMHGPAAGPACDPLPVWVNFFTALKRWRSKVKHQLQFSRRQEAVAHVDRAIERRIGAFMDGRRLGAYIATVLERPRSQPIMHVTRESKAGQEYEIYTLPSEVKALLAGHWRDWCKKRNPLVGTTADTVPDCKVPHAPVDLWRKIYAPRPDIDPDLAYKDQFADPTEPELDDTIKHLKNGAGGPSNTTNGMLKFLWQAPEETVKTKKAASRAAVPPPLVPPPPVPPPSGTPSPTGAPPAEAAAPPSPRWGRALLLAFTSEALRLRDLPQHLCQANIFGIPKKGVWDGDLENNLRPISLQEVGLKLATGLLNRRLTKSIETHGLLKGANYGFRAGMSTDDALHLINAILEDAKEFKKPIYILLQDIRRAYDSVSWESMELSLRRLRIPEEYITFHRNLYKRRRARAITGHGLSDEFDLECGLPQGGIESPMHWLIFYDALLCAQMRLDEMALAGELGEEWKAKGLAYVMGGPHESNSGPPPLRVSGTAYADDTQWLSSSKEGIQLLAEAASDFFRLHDIEVNAKKTEFTYNNVSPAPSPPSVAGRPVGIVLKPDEHFKLLGVWMSANLSWTRQRQYVRDQIRSTVATIEHKQLTAEESCYLIEAVVQARIAYGLKLLHLTPTQCLALDREWLRVVKHHAGLASSTSNYALWSHDTFRLTRTEHLQAAYQISDAQVRLCGPEHSMLSRAMAHRVRALQHVMGVPLLPFEFPNADVPLCGALARSNLLAALLPQMQQRQCRLVSNHARYAAFTYLPGRRPWPSPAELDRRLVLALHIPRAVFRVAAPLLYHAGVCTMDVITGADGRTICDWADLYRRCPKETPLPARMPSWWPTIVKAITEDDQRTLLYPMSMLDRPTPLAAAGVRTVKHASHSFVAVFPTAQLHLNALPLVGRVTGRWQTGSRNRVDAYLLEHWARAPRAADAQAYHDNAYCRCDGHCATKSKGAPAFAAPQGTGRYYWHDNSRCDDTHGVGEACDWMSQCDGKWDPAAEPCSGSNGWWEEEDTLLPIPCQPELRSVFATGAAAGAGQTTTSGRGRKRRNLAVQIEYARPDLSARKLRELRLLARAKAVEDDDTRFQRHLLSPQDEVALRVKLAEREAAGGERVLRGTDDPLSAAEATMQYYDAGRPTLADEACYQRELKDGTTSAFVYWANQLTRWQDIEAMQRAAAGTSEPTPANVWTDGSLTRGVLGKAGCAAYWPSELNGAEAQADTLQRVRGLQENNKAELQAAIIADVFSPFGAILRTDSQNVVSWFDEFVTHANERSTRQFVRHPCSTEIYAWARLRQLYNDRGRPLTLIKVKAHGTDRHNNAVDLLAKAAADKPLAFEHENIFVPPALSLPAVLIARSRSGARRVEGDPKLWIETLGDFHTHFAWAAQPGQGEFLTHKIDIAATLAPLTVTSYRNHRKKPSRKANGHRKTGLSFLLATPPVGKHRVRTDRGLYAPVNPTGICVRCGTTQPDVQGRPRLVRGPVEDFEHALMCPSAGAQATRAAAEDAFRQVCEAELGRGHIANCLRVSLIGSPAQPADVTKERLEVLRGMIPHSIREYFDSFSMPGKAFNALYKTVTATIAEHAHAHWRGRCDAQILWERACKITQGQKLRRKPPRIGARVREKAKLKLKRALPRRPPAPPCPTCLGPPSKHPECIHASDPSRSCPPEYIGWRRAIEAMEIYDRTKTRTLAPADIKLD